MTHNPKYDVNPLNDINDIRQNPLAMKYRWQ